MLHPTFFKLSANFLLTRWFVDVLFSRVFPPLFKEGLCYTLILLRARVCMRISIFIKQEKRALTHLQMRQGRFTNASRRTHEFVKAFWPTRLNELNKRQRAFLESPSAFKKCSYIFSEDYFAGKSKQFNYIRNISWNHLSYQCIISRTLCWCKNSLTLICVFI